MRGIFRAGVAADVQPQPTATESPVFPSRIDSTDGNRKSPTQARKKPFFAIPAGAACFPSPDIWKPRKSSAGTVSQRGSISIYCYAIFTINVSKSCYFCHIEIYLNRDIMIPSKQTRTAPDGIRKKGGIPAGRNAKARKTGGGRLWGIIRNGCKNPLNIEKILKSDQRSEHRAAGLARLAHYCILHSNDKSPRKSS